MIKLAKIFSIALFWFLVWELVALAIDNILLFPDPITVIQRLCQIAITSEFWANLSASLLRVMFGIIIAIAIGTLLAFLSAWFKLVYDVLFPLMTVIRATPVASFIILIFLFVGKESLPTVIALLMVMPIVWNNVYEGISNIDKDLKEVCGLYKLSLRKRLKVLYFPSVMPYFSSAVLSSIGLGWKAGIATEILYPPVESIGKAILDSKQLFLTEDLFALTVVVVLLSFIFELLLKLTMKLSSKKRKGEK